MNALEYQMADMLMSLSKNFSVTGVKLSLEDEGISFKDLHRAKDFISHAGLSIYLKIGGAEALSDIYEFALEVGVRGIVAPMVESWYGLQKFITVIKEKIAEDNRRDIEFFFNLETIGGFRDLDAMLKLPDLDLLTGITVGRVDLTGSMKLDRGAINTSREVLEICKKVFFRAHDAGIKTCMGGGISTEALPVIAELNKNGFLDKFETRNVIFPGFAWKYGEAAIREAVKFELLWILSRGRYNSRIQAENKQRVRMLVERLGEEGQEIYSHAQEIIAKVTS